MAMVTMTKTQPYVDSTPLLDDPAAIHARAEEDGHLFFRGLLDKAKVVNVRRQVISNCS